MKANNKFDAKIELWQFPEYVKEACVYVVDTLEILHAGAVEVFGDNVPPEIVIAMYDRVVRKVRELQSDSNNDVN